MRLLSKLKLPELAPDLRPSWASFWTVPSGEHLVCKAGNAFICNNLADLPEQAFGSTPRPAERTHGTDEPWPVIA